MADNFSSETFVTSSLSGENTTTNGLCHAPRSQKIEVQLREQIARLADNAQIPTVRELCRTLHASANTVSQALHTLESEKVIQRVHGIGIFVAPRHRLNIALIAHSSFYQLPIASPFWSLLLEGLRASASGVDYHTSLHLVDEKDDNTVMLAKDLQLLIEHRVLDGAIVIGINTATVKWLETINFPAVSFASTGRWNVGIDGRNVIVSGVKALSQAGCRRIALWQRLTANLYVDAIDNAFNHELFRQELLGENLDYDATYCTPQKPLSNPENAPISAQQTHPEQGAAMARAIFSRPQSQRPDGLIITEDRMAAGALQQLNAMGLRIGRDVQVSTHANVGSPVLWPWHEQIARVEVDPRQVANALLSMLRMLMQEKNPAPQTLIVGTQLVAPNQKNA